MYGWRSLFQFRLFAIKFWFISITVFVEYLPHIFRQISTKICQKKSFLLKTFFEFVSFQTCFHSNWILKRNAWEFNYISWLNFGANNWVNKFILAYLNPQGTKNRRQLIVIFEIFFLKGILTAVKLTEISVN